MTGWYIAGGIIAFFLLLLFLPIQIRVFCKEELSLKVRYAFLSFKILPPKEKKKEKKKAAEKKEKPKKEAESAPSKLKELKTKLREILKYQGVSGLLSLLKDFAMIAVGTGKNLCARFVIKKFDLMLAVGSGDPGETALTYGKMCGVVYPAVGTIVTACKCRKYGVTVCPDFDASETRAEFSACGQIRPVFLLAYAVQGLYRFVKRLIRLNRELEKAESRQTSPKN